MAKEDRISATPGVAPPRGWIMIREAETGKDYWVDPKSLKESEPPSRPNDAQIVRIKRIASVLQELDPSPLDEWFENIGRDRSTEAGIQTWEELVDVYQMELADRPLAQKEERQLIYGVLVTASMLTSIEACEIGNVLSMYPKAKGLQAVERIVGRFRERRFGPKPD